MPMIVANNLNALGINRNLTINNRNLSTSLRNLSTGYKINTGADAPSGLVISEQLRAQTVGLEQAVQNTQETSNVMGIAEGALSEVNNILKKMRQLAIHSANNGVTSAEQIAADQAELDSSIQTIDRIARTTKYSDQFLLNGNKAINTEAKTNIQGTQNNSLIDMSMSYINQAPANGTGMTINFNGTDSADSAAIGEASMRNEARKAYFEIDGADSKLDTANNTFTRDQFFTLSGNKGSRMLSFAKGTNFGEMVNTINSISGSTGAEAEMIFNSSQTVDMIAYTTDANITVDPLQTDVSGGDVPTFSAANVISGQLANINSADVTERFDIYIEQDNAGQITLSMIDDDGRNAGTFTTNLTAQTTTGDYTQTINQINLGGGTFIPSFDYNYSYDSSGSVYNNVVNTVIFHCDDDGTNVADNGKQYNDSTGNPRDLVAGGLPASMNIGNGDRVGNSFLVRGDMRADGTVDITITDNSGQISDTFNEDLNGSRTGDLGIKTKSVSRTFSNGSQIDFNYSFEAYTDANPNPTENTASQDLITVNGHTNATSNLGATTTGPDNNNVTAPYIAENASQSHDVRLNIYDVVNGETPLEVSTEAGGSASEVVFVVTGANSGELLRETVTLNALSTCSTGSQTVSLETPNGTTIEFDYFYENNPRTGEYDNPLGKLFEFSADPVNKDPVFNGLSSSAIASGAALNFNLNPSDPDHVSNLEYGRNTDGQGRLFIQITDHDTASQQIKFKLYKDENMNEANLVGSGTGLADGSDIHIHQANNSNLAGTISFDDAGGSVDLQQELAGKQTYLGVGGIWGTNGVNYSNGFAINASEAGQYDQGSTIISGVALAENTDNNGKLYISTVQDGSNSGQVFIYKNKAMRDEDLVAMSEKSQDLSADKSIIINAANNSGLAMILTTGSADWNGSDGITTNAELNFENLGVRISASEYGSNQYLSIKQEEGEIWKYYSPGDNIESKVVTSQEGASKADRS